MNPTGNSTHPTSAKEILEELRPRELVFHQPESGTSRNELAQVTDENFWEVGASGRMYDREYVLDELERRSSLPPEHWQATDFACREIAADIYLLTYTLAQHDRVTRRATIWRRTRTGWKIMYHQGTIVTDF